MAVIVFSGGHTLRVSAPASNVADALRSTDGLIAQSWCEYVSGDATVHINPQQIAYLVDDQQFDETFGPHAGHQ
jgi:hypothetical protein